MCRPDLHVDDDDNSFSPRRWANLVKAVTQRNSQEGMTELELIGEPDPYCEYYDEESAEDSSEETNSESEEPDDGTEQTNSELDDKIEEANSESEENET